MNAAANIFEAIIRWVFEFFHMGFDMAAPPERDPALKASFETDQQVLSVYHEGFCIDGRRSMSKEDSFRHAVLIGKSGVGKSTSTFIPSLLTMHTSGSALVIHDPSDELRKVCAGHLRQQGYRVMVLDFSSPDRSIGFNPLAKIKDTSDVNKIASMLVRTTLKQKDPFWDGSSEQLVRMTISLALKMPAQCRNLANVLHLIKLMGAEPKKVDALMAKYADDKLFVDYKAFLAGDSKVTSGVIATATTALGIFSDEKVALVTSEDTLGFDTLRKKRIALFIQNKISDQQYYNVLISLWFEQLFKSLLDRLPTPQEKGIYLLIDEAASGLRMPSLSNAIANFRTAKVGVLLGLQSVEQIKEAYGDNDAATILSNCYLQMYFSGQSHNTARTLQDILGRYSYEDENGNRSHTRNLMEADEIRMIPKDRAIILVGSEKPIFATLTPYYVRWWLRMRADIKPPAMLGVGIGNRVEYVYKSMAKSQKHSGLHKHLQDTGVLESGDSELIARVRAAYWRRYHKEYKREKRGKEKEYVVSLNGIEQKIMQKQATGHGQSLTAFIKGAAWAYVHQAYIRPDKEKIAHIAQVLSLCYSGIESLMASGKGDPNELGKVLNAITAIDQKLDALSSRPLNLEQAIRKALEEKPYYIITLKRLVEDHDHKEQGEEEHKVS